MKKKLCYYIKIKLRSYFFQLRVIFVTNKSYQKICVFFLANKPLVIVHWHPEISRKLVILCSETSKLDVVYGWSLSIRSGQ